MSHTQRRPDGRPPTIALIGPDGSGKSTIARRVTAALPVPARYLYMGVNLDSSTEMLPTTRLVLSAKRRSGRRPDMTGRASTRRPGVRGTVRSVVRTLAWMAEEWYRAALAGRARARGEVVIFDRHFFCDYYATDVRAVDAATGEPPRTVASRLHGAVLRRFYPRPDATFLLDAPAAVLFTRKGEGTIESIEGRQADYRALGEVLPHFETVDVDRPIDAVVADLVDRIGRIVEGVMPVSGPVPTGVAR